MSKYNMEDLRLLSNLSKILIISASKNVEIVKKENGDKCTFLAIKDTDKDRIILSIDEINTDNMIGSYVNWVFGNEMNYSIRRIFNNTFMLELIDKLGNVSMKFLVDDKEYTNPLTSSIINGLTEIELSSIDDLQILTKEESKKGQQLVKQNKPRKAKNS